MMIAGPIADHARRKASAPAIVCDDVVVTWRALEDSILCAAADLNVRAPAGRVVALVLGNTPGFLAYFLACARTGRVAAVVDASWPPARIADVLQRLAPDLVIDARPAEVSPLLGNHASGFSCDDPEAPFYIGFTSGSTGRPKAYERSHRSWVASFEADAVEFGLNETDVVLAPGSMAHSLFLYAAVHALHIGATVVMCRVFRPDRALQLAAEWRATAAYAAPTQWKMLLEQRDRPLPHVRWAFSSGAKWFAAASGGLAKLLPNARFTEFYGASELSFVAVRKPGEGCPEESVGRAFAGVTISIRSPDGALCASGEPGRIFVASPYLFSRYAFEGDAPARLGDAISVGDLGVLDENGFLRLVGRENRMIVTSGKNVYPEEIEAAIQSFPGVRAAAALGVPDERRGERIVAFVLPAEGCEVRRRALSAHLRAALPLPFVPRIIAKPENWRWTASGKTDHPAMRGIWDSGQWELLK